MGRTSSLKPSGSAPKAPSRAAASIAACASRSNAYTRERVTKELAAGEPPIQLGRVHGTGDKGLLVSVLTLQVGEDRVVAARLKAILQKAAG